MSPVASVTRRWGEMWPVRGTLAGRGGGPDSQVEYFGGQVWREGLKACEMRRPQSFKKDHRDSVRKMSGFTCEGLGGRQGRSGRQAGSRWLLVSSRLFLSSFSSSLSLSLSLSPLFLFPPWSEYRLHSS